MVEYPHSAPELRLRRLEEGAVKHVLSIVAIFCCLSASASTLDPRETNEILHRSGSLPAWGDVDSACRGLLRASDGSIDRFSFIDPREAECFAFFARTLDAALARHVGSDRCSSPEAYPEPMGSIQRGRWRLKIIAEFLRAHFRSGNEQISASPELAFRMYISSRFNCPI